jgi:hypothetical protein
MENSHAAIASFHLGAMLTLAPIQDIPRLENRCFVGPHP